MGGPIGGVLEVLLVIVLGTFGLVFGIYLFFKLFGLIWRFIGNVFRFIGATVADAVRLVGTVIAAPIFALLVVANVVIGRWSASGHFGRAFGGECRSFVGCLYRLAISNPLNLVGLGGVLEGVEQRVPQAMAEAPGRDTPNKRRVGMFDGYTIVGSLPGGGSGGKLYIAQPDEIKRAALSRRGAGDVDRVVIKVFSQRDGSTLDQILRESRALEAARRLGLVLEHESSEDRFFYVMRYVPGESLGAITTRLHAKCPPDGLTDVAFGEIMGYASDLLASLQAYHEGGLWHKDVKPENIIVDEPGTRDARAHLVDLGLVTPMRSAMTLTTHGTEFFRDPELVRQALRGVKVHQIDGAKFDVYSAGAVLFSVIENSFPAHGGLSQITKRCPEALRWVIRRAMAEYDHRYPTAAAMLGDLEAIRRAPDPFALKPADLPSMGAEMPAMPEPPEQVRVAATPVPPAVPASPAPPAPAQDAGAFAGGGRRSPKLSVEDWWTGRYKPSPQGEMQGAMRGKVQEPAPTPAPEPAPMARGAQVLPVAGRAPAAEQRQHAKERAKAARERAHARMSSKRSEAGSSIRAARAQRRIDHRRGVVRPVRSATESRGRWGIFGALVLVMIVGGLLVGSLTGFLHTRQSQVVSSETVFEDSRDWGFAPDAPDTPDTPDVWGWQSGHLPETGASVLVLSDLPTPVSDETETAVHNALGFLQYHGAELVGDFTGDDAPIDQVAAARAARGLTPLEPKVLRNRLTPMIEGDDDLDAVIWIEAVRGSSGAHRFVLVAPGVHSSQHSLHDRTPQNLLVVLSKLSPAN